MVTRQSEVVIRAGDGQACDDDFTIGLQSDRGAPVTVLKKIGNDDAVRAEIAVQRTVGEITGEHEIERSEGIGMSRDDDFAVGLNGYRSDVVARAEFGRLFSGDTETAVDSRAAVERDGGRGKAQLGGVFLTARIPSLPVQPRSTGGAQFAIGGPSGGAEVGCQGNRIRHVQRRAGQGQVPLERDVTSSAGTKQHRNSSSHEPETTIVTAHTRLPPALSGSSPVGGEVGDETSKSVSAGNCVSPVSRSGVRSQWRGVAD